LPAQLDEPHEIAAFADMTLTSPAQFEVPPSQSTVHFGDVHVTLWHALPPVHSTSQPALEVQVMSWHALSPVQRTLHVPASHCVSRHAWVPLQLTVQAWPLHLIGAAQLWIPVHSMSQIGELKQSISFGHELLVLQDTEHGIPGGHAILFAHAAAVAQSKKHTPASPHAPPASPQTAGSHT
jgi:hypothetical protein